MKLPCLLLLLSHSGALADWKPVTGKIATPWAAKVDPAAIWQEYPRPQLQRGNWTCLNGLWDWGVASAERGVEEGKKRGIAETTGIEWRQILVPFCPESSLSGVGRLIEPDEALWYRRELPGKPVAGERTLLHFEAVDYETTVWVNGREVGRHTGGSTPFSFDITDALGSGGNKLVVRVLDATEDWQLRGKQALKPQGITYTRVTGIWQTVWLEQVPKRFVANIESGVAERLKQESGDKHQEIEEGKTVDGAEGEKKDGERTEASLLLRAKLGGKAVSGESLRVAVSYEGKEVASAKGSDALTIDIPDAKWWTPNTPSLYDLKVELLDGSGKVLDTVQSYTALRTVVKRVDARRRCRIALNGRDTFLMGTLDQGWWPDGLLTPPSEEAMVSDLKFLKAAGFNMVRKHVKVENSRYYYWCDKLGLAVWQDQVSAGMWVEDQPAGASPPWTRLNPNPKDATWPENAKQQWITEYKAMVDTLRGHPSILIWSLFNESWGQHDSMELGKMAKDYDPTRLICIASGGNFWPVGDIASQHEYPGPSFRMDDRRFKDYVKVCGEMGGYGWPVEGHIWDTTRKKSSHGQPQTLDLWKESYTRSMDILTTLRDFGLSAAVYTQTSDVENEVNGLLTYDRIPKLDATWLKQINERLIKPRERPQP